MKAVGIVRYLPVEEEDAFVDFEAETPEPDEPEFVEAVVDDPDTSAGESVENPGETDEEKTND